MGLTTDRFALTVGVYNDTQQNAIALRDVGVGVPVLTQVGALGIWLPKFAINDKLIFIVQFPHSLKEDANVSIHPHVHWIGSTTDAANAVRWQLTYQWLNIGEALGADTIITTDDLAVANTLQIIDFASQVKAGALISSIIMGNITRITNGATNYAGDVFLQFLDFHHLNDTLGSDTDTAKTWP